MSSVPFQGGLAAMLAAPASEPRLPRQASLRETNPAAVDAAAAAAAADAAAAMLSTSVQPAGWAGYQAMMERPVERQGVLYKQSGKDTREWKRRVVALRDGVLHYAPSEEEIDAGLAKTIRLDTVNSLRTHDAGGEACFQLVTRSRRQCVLRAETRDEMQDWLFTFHRAVAAVVLRILATRDDEEAAADADWSPITPRQPGPRALLVRSFSDVAATGPDGPAAAAAPAPAAAPAALRDVSSDADFELDMDMDPGMQPPQLLPSKSAMHHTRPYVPPALRRRQQQQQEADEAAAGAAAPAPAPGRWVPPQQRAGYQPPSVPSFEDELAALDAEDDDDLGMFELDEQPVAPPAPPSAPPEAPQQQQQFKGVGVAEDCGLRSKMEDAVLVLPEAGGGAALYGVFDGHAGRRAADAVVAALPDALAAPATAAMLGAGDAAGALRAAFAAVDAAFLREAREEDLGDGSTAVVALVFPGQRVVVANTGDSRAVLCEAGRAVALSEPHSPGDPAERARIEAAGGWVTEERELMYSRLHHMDLRSSEIRSKAQEVVRWVSIFRVNGDLAVSRAFGDADYKGAGMAAFPWNYPDGHARAFSADLVLVDPDVVEAPVTPESEFLLLACDGVWDVIELQDAVTHVRGRLAAGAAVEAAARSLVDLALRLGSNDNVTAMVVVL